MLRSGEVEEARAIFEKLLTNSTESENEYSDSRGKDNTIQQPDSVDSDNSHIFSLLTGSKHCYLYNNLSVAEELLGRGSYARALSLCPGDERIRENFRRHSAR